MSGYGVCICGEPESAHTTVLEGERSSPKCPRYIPQSAVDAVRSFPATLTARHPLERIADALTLLAVHSEKRDWENERKAMGAKGAKAQHPLSHQLGTLEGKCLLRLAGDAEVMPSAEQIAQVHAEELGVIPPEPKS